MKERIIIEGEKMDTKMLVIIPFFVFDFEW